MMQSFSPDRRDSLLPLPEVEERRTEFRRVSRRVRVPPRYVRVADGGEASPLAISLLSHDSGAVIAEGFLFDINDGGVGFASPDILSPGDEGLLIAHYEGDLRPVHSGRMKVLHAHEIQHLEANEVPDRFRKQALMIYGTALTHEEVSGFMRYTLESLALQQELRQVPGRT